MDGGNLTGSSKTPPGGGDIPLIIGESAAMMSLLAQIEQVAPLDATVLLEGESGTGKEVIARLIHAYGRRNKGRFMEVTCGTLPETLLESTLFGFEKGAFTGAAQATAGCFESADGGTLFLDEISDMSAKLQSSLLRVLQERHFMRIGGTVQRHSDFRLVCATNKPLAELVSNGNFRDDLYYRINVVSIQLPPLRERGRDVIILAAHFLAHFNAKFGKVVGPFNAEAAALLMSCPWPGNVRQLQHTVERIVALHSGGEVTCCDVGKMLRDMPGQGSVTRALGGAGIGPYWKERENFEREYLVRLLEASSGNMAEAARMSGVLRQNLYVRLRKWGIAGYS